MKELKKRFTSETPTFFKKIRNICIGIGVIGGAITTAVATGGIALPATVSTIVGYMTAIGAFGAGLSQCAKVDGIEIKHETEK